MKVNESANVDQVASNDADQSNEVTTPEVKVDSSLERVLQESKKFKERALKAEKELELKTKAALAEQGKYKELYETAMSTIQESKKQMMRDKVASAVRQEAAKLGCVAPDEVMALVKPNFIEFDEDTMSVSGVELALADVKHRIPSMFQKQSSAVINPSTPNGVDKQRKLNPADIVKMPHNSKMELWAAAMNGMKKQ